MHKNPMVHNLVRKSTLLKFHYTCSKNILNTHLCFTLMENNLLQLTILKQEAKRGIKPYTLSTIRYNLNYIKKTISEKIQIIRLILATQNESTITEFKSTNLALC